MSFLAAASLDTGGPFVDAAGTTDVNGAMDEERAVGQRTGLAALVDVVAVVFAVFATGDGARNTSALRLFFAGDVAGLIVFVDEVLSVLGFFFTSKSSSKSESSREKSDSLLDIALSSSANTN